MVIRKAVEGDFTDWLTVARDVADIFGNPDMGNDPEFLEYAQRKMKQSQVITAFDEEAQACIGFIAFSNQFNRITWLGVLSAYRNRGIGSRLLEAALEKLDDAQSITVETFRGDYAPGLPARHVYMKQGFRETEHTRYDSFGNERCKMTLNHKPLPETACPRAPGVSYPKADDKAAHMWYDDAKPGRW